MSSDRGTQELRNVCNATGLGAEIILMTKIKVQLTFITLNAQSPAEDCNFIYVQPLN